MIKRIRLAAAGALALAAGCAGVEPGTPTPEPSSGVLSVSELEAYPGYTLLTVLQAEKPNWIRARGRGSVFFSDHVRVYLNGFERGGPNVLGTLRPHQVARVEYLDGHQATVRLGTGHPNGAILVTMK